MNDQIKNIITDIEFENDITFDGDLNNPVSLENFIEYHKDIDMSKLEQAVKEKYQKAQVGVTKEEMKEVFKMLKERELHPAGSFDKAGRFYLRDSELVSVRRPSAQYPYSQMNAGRTSKFVKDISEKYKVQSKEELIALFRRAE